jgi:hypothetical protein
MSEGWHLDRRVPIAIILAIVGQTVLGGIWIGRMETRIESLEEWQRGNARIDARLAVLENQNLEIRRSLDEMNGNLRRLWDRGRQQERP